MILLDTNIISNFMQKKPNLQVSRWLDMQDMNSIYLPSIAIAEIHFGLERLAQGKQRLQLSYALEIFLQQGFEHRILGFNQKEALAYAVLRAKRESQGKPIAISDAQIAAIAHVHGFAVATQNIKDFQDCGIRLINPFEI